MSYSPTLGRWVQQDPKGYVDGLNLQEYVGSSPPNGLDPLGLENWAKKRPLTQAEKDQLKVAVCVLEKAGLLNPKLRDRLRNVIDGIVQVGTPMNKNSPLGETHWTSITLSDAVVSDRIFGPSVLVHEFTHWDTNLVTNGIYDVMEWFGADAVSPPAIAGDKIAAALSKLDNQLDALGRSKLDDLYCHCGDHSRCKGRACTKPGAKPPATQPTTQPTTQPSTPGPSR